MNRLVWTCAAVWMLWAGRAQAQVIEFESNGLKYQTLTRSGVTVMFAVMPQHLRDYAILQRKGVTGAAVVAVAPKLTRRGDVEETYQRAQTLTGP